MLIDTQENGLNLVIEVGTDGAARLLHFSALEFDPETVSKEERLRRRNTLVEVHVSGENQHDHHGGKHTGSNCDGPIPKYIRHNDIRSGLDRKIEIFQESNSLEIVTHILFVKDLPVIRSWTSVRNISDRPVGLEYVSSFALAGLTKEQGSDVMEETYLHVSHNSWKSEFQWRRYSLAELGLTPMSEKGFSMKRISYANTGTWAAKEFLPMGVFETAQRNHYLFWQIESHGSWHWEVGDIADQLYLQLSGPTERENQWWKNLQPGETFESVPVAIGAIQGNCETCFLHLNDYRRSMRRAHFDNAQLPVIFNDYMNCLMGDPTTEKLLPLIDKAAEAGAEYFVIDAGWYDDGPWFAGVGEWLPSLKRFPGGIEEPLEYIREKGMVPGLWLEIERMGINCRLASEWPDECFFMRHGKRVIDHDSYQLDFRHPIVVEHADAVIKRVVEEYGCDFIKMDYNIEIGPGTEVDADSFGDGLLGHTRAYKNWLAGAFSRYPDLVIENCSSGGMRMTYGLMDLHTTSSTTDNQDYLMNARISINSSTAVCPEQAGVWAYPLMDSTEESVIMNMISAMSWRIYLSGQMQAMEGTRWELLKEGIEVYKSIRKSIPQAEPIWPLGLVKHESGWGAFGLKQGNELLLSVWRFNGSESKMSIPIGFFEGDDLCASCLYPAGHPVPVSWQSREGSLEVELDSPRKARLFKLSKS